MSEPETPQTPEQRWTRGRIAGVAISGVLALGLIALLVLGLARDTDRFKIDHAMDQGERVAAPDFTLPVFANGGSLGAVDTPLTLSKLRGRPVVLNIWASWCGPCRDEAPIIEDLQRRYGPKGVVVLGLNSEDDPGDARKFLAEYRATFPVVRAGDNAVRTRFGTEQMPETFVIDPDGNFGLKPFRGPLDADTAAEIAAHLDSVLGP